MEYNYEYRENVCALVCKLTDETINSYVYYMLANNNISNVIKPVYEQGEDGYERLVYRLDGMCTLQDYMQSISNMQYLSDGSGLEERLQIIYNGLKNLWAELDSYMVDDRYCIWDFNYVYVDCTTGEPYIVCLATDNYVSDRMERDTYLNYIAQYTGIQESYVDTYEEEDEYESLYDDNCYETRILCQSDLYGHVPVEGVGEDVSKNTSKETKKVKIKPARKKRERKVKEVKDKRIKEKKVKVKRVKEEKVEGKRVKKERSKKQPKIVKLTKVNRETPQYIIPGVQ